MSDFCNIDPGRYYGLDDAEGVLCPRCADPGYLEWHGTDYGVVMDPVLKVYACADCGYEWPLPDSQKENDLKVWREHNATQPHLLEV